MNSHRRRPGSIIRRNQINSQFWPRKLLAMKLVCGNDGGRRSSGYVQGKSAVSSRMKEIEGVGTV